MTSDSPSSWTDAIEETLISALLGLMTVLTFANVVARYGFNSNILWALELTVFMFGWLVLLGASYAVKKGIHLGVDIIVLALAPPMRRILGLMAVTACIVFSFLMLKGAWDYWANFADLPQTTGRWFPTGFQETFRTRAWYETQDVPNPGFLKFLEDMLNEGEEYEKLPKVVPYLVLPLSMALLLFRFIQAGIRIWRGDLDRIVASHEAEDDVAEAAAKIEGSR
ncbi:TRAP transporter small permease [Actibacterium sp. 188UL27-1]|uniref:TRAP transporter small permease n=1 Tax=Actibacterium sp. 188UL27-1 TaxID=2786961 RepID=UPI00195EBF10|nr:TRAP transporter small permease [Actibacterium sp. 188UL27-1]MBM7070261.1 TRAP transporter small permease [Actibacterium sp. 188UL27-1]